MRAMAETARPRETPRKPSNPRRHRKEPPKAPAVQVHAHRGGAKLRPENTQAAFGHAVALGAHFIEFDVRTCATGELVVIHDATLQRVGGEPARVDQLSLAELQSIDVGSHFAPEYGSERVPTLIEVLETWRDQVRFNIEIKEDAPQGDGTATAVGRLVSSMGLYADAIISSFSPLSLARARRMTEAPMGLCYPMDGGRGLRGRIRDRVMRRPWSASLVSVYALHPSDAVVDAELVRRAHLRGLAINVWTVDDPERMAELAGMMVTGIISDRPDIALQITQGLDPLQRKAPGLPS